MDNKERVISKRPLGNDRYEVTERRRIASSAVMRSAFAGMGNAARFLPQEKVRKTVGGEWVWANAPAAFGWQYCIASCCYRHRRGGKGVPLASALRYLRAANPDLADIEIDPATGDAYYTSTNTEDWGVLAPWFGIPAK